MEVEDEHVQEELNQAEVRILILLGDLLDSFVQSPNHGQAQNGSVTVDFRHLQMDLGELANVPQVSIHGDVLVGQLVVAQLVHELNRDGGLVLLLFEHFEEDVEELLLDTDLHLVPQLQVHFSRRKKIDIIQNVQSLVVGEVKLIDVFLPLPSVGLIGDNKSLRDHLGLGVEVGEVVVVSGEVVLYFPEKELELESIFV